MNSAEITRARPELVQQAETLRRHEGPAVGEIQKSDTGNGDVSDETTSGFFRLAEFIKLEKTKPRNRDPRRQHQTKALQAYDLMANFGNRPVTGRLLNIRT